jgi:hypothetical protein
MSICDIIFGGAAIAAAIKFFAELVRLGNAASAGWSTVKSVGEVTSKLATSVAIAGGAVATYASKQPINVQGDSNECS